MRRFALSVPLAIALLFSAFAPCLLQHTTIIVTTTIATTTTTITVAAGGIIITAIVGGIDFSLKTRKAPVSLPGLPGLLKQGRIV